MTTKVKTLTPEMRAFQDDAMALLRKHSDALDAQDAMALTAQMVGMLLAGQDQRTITVERALAVIHANIELGNATAVKMLHDADTTLKH
jgi:hypothetical protein